MAERRLYFDHDCADGEVVAELRRRGFDCLTTREAGRHLAPDDEQLRFATAQARIILTSNAGHFAALHVEWITTGKEHGGIIVVRQYLPVGSRVRRTVAVVNRIADMRNRLEYLSSWADE